MEVRGIVHLETDRFISIGMRRQKSKSNGTSARTARPNVRVRPSAQRASELMELATVAAHSRDLPEFLKLFSDRVAHMLSAGWCGVVVIRGQEAELQGGRDSQAFGLKEDEILARAKQASQHKGIHATSHRKSGSSNGTELLVVPVHASDGDPLGAICIYGARPEIIHEEKKLLHALASHAALSLENFRRFSQLERSKFHSRWA